ncbi:hypothetical protein [Neoasaia chiangmaiensis]|nr:hypothetical protein [Neoasaia chiangmaiensis]
MSDKRGLGRNTRYMKKGRAEESSRTSGRGTSRHASTQPSSNPPALQG